MEDLNPGYSAGYFHNVPCTSGNCSSTVAVSVVHLMTFPESMIKYVVAVLYLLWCFGVIFTYVYNVTRSKPLKGKIGTRIKNWIWRKIKAGYFRVKERVKKKIQGDLYIKPDRFEKPDPSPHKIQRKWRQPVDVNQMNRFRRLRRRRVFRQSKFEWYE
ncbi:hypothetical protein TWF481_011703 [Arthrobotrys musiformis]|uniref:Uncharacterized protein n=1 Tax=Arthrobotrys musiformis TaxID=47236 RepID=A0AAV9VZB6_9PEZI